MQRGWSAYNGKLYNANELIHSDFTNLTNSDTPIFSEVVIDQRIPLADVDGMFAFVHYVTENKKIMQAEIFMVKNLYLSMRQMD